MVPSNPFRPYTRAREVCPIHSSRCVLRRRARTMTPSAFWLPPAIAVAAYLNGLRGDWLDDDPVAIVDNPDVPCPRGLRGLFDNLHDVLAHDFWGTPLADATSHLSWRPLTILAFRAQHAVVGYDKFSFHAANALLHAAVTRARSVLRPLLRRRSQRRRCCSSRCTPCTSRR